MPTWLKRQLMKAFYHKNRYQIRILNDCWYYYKKQQKNQQKSSERIS